MPAGHREESRGAAGATWLRMARTAGCRERGETPDCYYIIRQVGPTKCQHDPRLNLPLVPGSRSSYLQPGPSLHTGHTASRMCPCVRGLVPPACFNWIIDN